MFFFFAGIAYAYGKHGICVAVAFIARIPSVLHASAQGTVTKSDAEREDSRTVVVHTEFKNMGIKNVTTRGSRAVAEAMDVKSDGGKDFSRSSPAPLLPSTFHNIFLFVGNKRH